MTPYLQYNTPTFLNWNFKIIIHLYLQEYSEGPSNRVKSHTSWDSWYSIFSFMCMFCGSLFSILFFFFLVIVLSVLLRFRYSDYPFDIFKHFVIVDWLTHKATFRHWVMGKITWQWENYIQWVIAHFFV